MSINVSVIVPIYNVDNYLEKCLQSLVKQTLISIEFIFIDDCSTDNSYSIIKDFFVQNPIFSSKSSLYRMERNSGVACVRNYGLSLAKGDYIGWVDSDDWVDNLFFEKLYRKATESSADIVWTDYVNVVEEAESFVLQSYPENNLLFIEGMIRGELLGVLWNKLYRRALFSDNSIQFPNNLNMCEDFRGNVQLFFYAKSIAYVEYGGYYYVKHNIESISAKSCIGQGINNEWVENVIAIVSFVKENIPSIKNIDLDKFKLAPKKNLLINGITIDSYKLWKNTLSESNYSIKYSNYPLKYKVLVFSIMRNWWVVVRLWILSKKVHVSLKKYQNA